MSTSESAGVSPLSNIVVAGDVCLDVLGLPIPPMPQSAGGGEENWRLTGETRTFYRRGGAWLLADFVEAGLKNIGRTDTVAQPHSSHATPANFEQLTRQQIVHSLLELKAFEEKEKGEQPNDKCVCEVTRIRVARSKGFSGPDKSKDPTKPTFPPLELSYLHDNRCPEVIVLDDTGNRFRHDPTIWPAALKTPAIDESNRSCPPPLIIYKLHRPLPKGAVSEQSELWKRIAGSELIRHTLIVTSIDDLRESGTPINRRLSWERTATELVWQLNGAGGSNPLSELRKCPHVLVRIGLEGAVYWCNPGDGKPPRAWLIYDPSRIEGDCDDQCAGTMVGFGSAFVAGLTTGLLIPDSLPEFSALRDGTAAQNYHASGGDFAGPRLVQAIRHGLLACRKLLRFGYGDWVSGNDPDPVYPTTTVFESLPSDDDAKFNVIAVSISNDPLNADPRDWSILNELFADGEDSKLAAELLTRLKKPGKAKGKNELAVARLLAAAPRGVFGNLITYDRREIESYRAVSNIVREYLGLAAPKRPLCLGVFGPPGSGKSFGVEEVAKSIAERSGAKIKKLTFNLSQFGEDDLPRSLHLVRDVVLKGEIPLVFFDEFDADGLKWLKNLLAPMQDGEFLEQGAMHPLGRAIFVFAGGTSHSYGQFVPKETGERGETSSKWIDFVKAKGPDFVSRLRGVLDIPGIEIDPATPSTAARLRRAGILRFQLSDKAKHLLDRDKNLQIDDDVLRAFLNVRRFHHGIRSLESLLDMSQLGGTSRYDAGSLPPPSQMILHVVPQTVGALPSDIGFLNLIHQASPFPLEVRERIARAIHEDYLAERLRTKEFIPDKPSHQPWARLSEFYRDSNRGQADDLPKKLRQLGNRCVAASAIPTGATVIGEFSESKIDILAQPEHDRWVAERRGQGWSYGPVECPIKKTHPAMLDWSKLPKLQKEKDRSATRAIPEVLGAAGYVIVE